MIFKDFGFYLHSRLLIFAIFYIPLLIDKTRNIPFLRIFIELQILNPHGMLMRKKY